MVDDNRQSMTPGLCPNCGYAGDFAGDHCPDCGHMLVSDPAAQADGVGEETMLPIASGESESDEDGGLPFGEEMRDDMTDDRAFE
jgi:hypothetical protein